MKAREIYIAGAVRTPIGKFGGSFRDLSAADLGEAAGREALLRAGVPPESVDEAIFGNARPAGARPNPARQIGHRIGLPESVPAYTVNKACGSGLRAIVSGAQAIRAGDAEVVLAGGSEAMSAVPYLLPEARWGRRLGHGEVVDSMYRDGFLCPLSGLVMGETAELLASEYGIGRDEQDRFALESQRRCAAARQEERFRAETVAVEVRGRKGSVTVAADEYPRDGCTMEDLARLKPVFSREGSVTAGNACGITDGAAACLVLSAEAAERLGVVPQARLAGYAAAGVEPQRMGVAPVPALRRLEERTGVAVEEVDLVELNEAFAVQVLAIQREMDDLDPGRTNVNGGAIALGHPVGCTGARIVATLLHELERRRARYGIATLCISGGLGMAALFERLES